MLVTQPFPRISNSPSGGETIADKAARALRNKYRITSYFYDILDYPWERQYRRWRSQLLQNVEGTILEAGVGTGRNLRYYRSGASVTGIDLSPGMTRMAARRARRSACDVTLLCRDATRLSDLPSDHFDWYIATFLYCVLPDELQPLALAEMTRVLKPGGKFKILEIIYSKDPRRLRRQQRLAPFVEKVYGGRFDRRTLALLQQNKGVELSGTRFLKADTYLLIEGNNKPPEGREAAKVDV